MPSDATAARTIQRLCGARAITISAAMHRTRPTRSTGIQPDLVASQPDSGAAKTPMTAAGVRYNSADWEADRPYPVPVFWLMMTTVKLMTANTPASTITVVAMTGQTWRERRCSTAIRGVGVRRSMPRNRAKSAAVAARYPRVPGCVQPCDDPFDTP